MNSNPNRSPNEGSELADFLKKEGLMERLVKSVRHSALSLAKNIRPTVLPLALLAGSCATVQSTQKTQAGELAEIEEIAPDIANRPSGFEKTKTVRTPDGLIFDLSTQFRVGGNPGFVAQFEMVESLFSKSPERVLYERGVKPSYDVIDQKDLIDMGEGKKQKVVGWSNYLYILRETMETLNGMVNVMKERRPNGFSANYEYGDYFEALESQMSRIQSELNRWGVTVMAKPAEIQAKKAAAIKTATGAAEKGPSQEFACYATGGKTPEQAAIAKFAKDMGLSVEQVEAEYVPEIVSQPEGALRKTVARMNKKSGVASVGASAKAAETPTAIAEKMLGQEFACYATGGKTPEQAAIAKFAKDTGLSVEEVGAKFVPEIVSPPEGALRKTIAKMAKKATVASVEAPAEPATVPQEQPKGELTTEQQKLVDSFRALKPEQRLAVIKADRIVIKGSASKFVIESGEVSQKSFPFLDQVAGAILANEIKKLQVECHTDNRGDKEKLLKRSQDCAESMKAYLVGKGIDPSRLVAEGFGGNRPVAPNLTKKGRELNRRVEFIFVAPDGQDPNEGKKD